jgi:hypothetical protein
MMHMILPSTPPAKLTGPYDIFPEYEMKYAASVALVGHLLILESHNSAGRATSSTMNATEHKHAASPTRVGVSHCNSWLIA